MTLEQIGAPLKIKELRRSTGCVVEHATLLHTANMGADVSVVTQLLVVDTGDRSEGAEMCVHLGFYVLGFIGSLYFSGFS